MAGPPNAYFGPVDGRLFAEWLRRADQQQGIVREGMTANDVQLTAVGLGRSSNARGVRTAAIRFGAAYSVAALIFAGIVWGFVGNSLTVSAWAMVVHYALCAIVAAGMSVLLFHLHERFVKFRTSEDSLPLLVIASFLLSLVAAPIWAALGYLVSIVAQWPTPAAFSLRNFGYDMAFGGGLLFGWSALFVTLVFAFELDDRKLRLAAAREDALEAQMRALRYQINSHFLFNTLNSIAGLIEEGEATQAERMVLSLSTFLRTTLTLDPFDDVTLGSEIALQEEYLEIERERFSDRMAFSIDAPDDVRAALVPSLILQPLVENAIKHGVGVTAGKVEIALRARRDADRLRVTIENDMPANGSVRKPEGMGVGLRNVADRLHARFRDEGRFSSGAVAPGRYRASIDLPWRPA